MQKECNKTIMEYVDTLQEVKDILKTTFGLEPENPIEYEPNDFTDEDWWSINEIVVKE